MASHTMASQDRPAARTAQTPTQAPQDCVDAQEPVRDGPTPYEKACEQAGEKTCEQADEKTCERAHDEPGRQEGPEEVQPQAPQEAPKALPLLRQLKELLLQLQQVQSAVMVSVAALRSQACDLDEDIAHVLQRAVAERLHEQMDKLETSLQQLASGQP